MRQQRHDSVQRANHDVKRHPQNEQPARPVLSLKQKRAANYRSERGDVDHPVTFQVCEAIGCIDQLHRCMDQRDEAKQDEEQTDNDDR